MKTVFLATLGRTVLPPLLGAAGALLATMYPAFYKALCGAPLTGGLY